MANPFLAALQRGLLVVDGSMGATIQNMPLDVERDYLGRENCVDVLVRSRPDIVYDIHTSFLEAGADAVETDTFGANKLVLAEFDEELASWTYELNQQAATIARQACQKHHRPDKPRFVLGSMGPGTKLLTLGQTTWSTMLDSYCEQALGLIDGGVDALLVETCQDLLQIKCAINACLRALERRSKTPEDVPLMVSVTVETSGTLLLGSEIACVLNALRPYPIATLGLNCATGPTEMADHVAYLSRHWARPISVVPNAGLPALVEGQTCFPLQPEPFAQTLSHFVEALGVNVVGGCCGTTPEHIRALCQALEGKAPGARPSASVAPGCSSLYSAVDYAQESSFFIVGERLNASGSRRFKQLLETENWDEIVSLARQQVREGANALDVNVDYAGRDNVADMGTLVSRLVQQVDAPLMIDSTQLATIEAGLQRAGGKCLINSANFEEGTDKFDHLCQLAKTYGAALVLGTIDEDEEAAMARTAERKGAIAQRAMARATRTHGLPLEDLFVDPLVLPISTGMAQDRRSALELIEAVKRLSDAFPDGHTLCGLSNVSFGLKPAARVVLNAVFLHELVEAGLTGAIVHASKILPLNRIPQPQYAAALDLIYDRRARSKGGSGLPQSVEDETFDPLHTFIELFKDVEPDAAQQEPSENLSLEEQLHRHIVDGEKQGLQQHLDAALERYAALEIVNTFLLGGMKEVGELFGSGQMQLPFVLQSAEVMKQAVAYLEPQMERVEGHSRGSIVLATVRGDVHDIGKNLVDIILSNNGFTVHNLGIKQPLASIVEALKQTDADAVGMSGLLVKSVKVMEENLLQLNELDLDVPVLVGGAALARHYAESHLRGLYNGALYYGKDAFEGLRICEALSEGKPQRLDTEIEERLAKLAAVKERVALMREQDGSEASSENVEPVPLDQADVPTPPFWGSRVVPDVPLKEVFPYINTAALFRGHWGFKSGKMDPAAYEAYLEQTVSPLFERLKQECIQEGWLRPQVVYGFWPCNSLGDDLIVFDPEDQDREIERFSFPRQTKGKGRCISDFFRSVDTGVKDVVAFHCVTVGHEASRRAKELFDHDRYRDYLYLHGLSVETAEALAELWHKRTRMELSIAGEDAPSVRQLFAQKYRGSRYSFGYPACPEMADQQKLFNLLCPERIGCVLSENWQIEPEQSTSALIVHHPQAKYFNV